MKLVLLFSLCVVLISCQTNMARQFDKIKPGTDKDAVLDLLGNPRAITRMAGEDRWYYMYYNDETRQQREVHFKDGLVIYSGEKKKPTPEIDPVVIDKKNAEVEKKFEEDIDARKEASKNAYNNYIKHERKMKKEDEVQYLPDFETVQ